MKLPWSFFAAFAATAIGALASVGFLLSSLTAEANPRPAGGWGIISPNRPFISTKWKVPTTATVTANAAAVNWANGDAQVVDLQGSTGTVTVTLTNPPASGFATALVLTVIQGDGADDVMLSPAPLTSGGLSLDAITTTDDAVDVLTFFYNGSDYILFAHIQDVQ